MKNNKFIISVFAFVVYFLCQIILIGTMIISVKNNIEYTTGSMLRDIINTWGMTMIAVIALIVVAMIVSDVMIIISIKSTTKIKLMENEIAFNEKLINENIEYYKRMEDKTATIKKIKHDFNNILFTAELLNTSETGNEDSIRILNETKEKLNKIMIGENEIV